MKIRIGLAALLFVATHLASAQEVLFKPELLFGARTGYGLSTINFSPRYLDRSHLTAQSYGLSLTYFTNYFYKTRWGIQLELNQVTKGWNDIWPNEYATTYARQLRYWEIPIFSQAYLGSGNWRWTISAGPFFNYLKEDTEIISSTALPEEEKPFYYGKPIHNRFQFGMGGGLGLVRTLPFGRLFIDARYMYNMQSVFSFDKDLSIATRHRYFEASAGLQIFILKGANSRKYQLEALQPKNDSLTIDSTTTEKLAPQATKAKEKEEKKRKKQARREAKEAEKAKKEAELKGKDTEQKVKDPEIGAKETTKKNSPKEQTDLTLEKNKSKKNTTKPETPDEKGKSPAPQ